MAEELGVLKVSLGLDDSDFSGSITQINAKLNALKSEFRAASTGVEGFEKSVEGMRTKADNLSKVLELQRQKASSLKQEYERVSQAYGANSVQAQKALTKYNNMISTINKTETQLRNLNAEIEKQGDKFYQMSQKLSAASTNLSAFGDKAKDVGGKLSVGLTAPIVAAGTAVGMIASQFEDAQVKIQNALGLSVEEAERFANVAEDIWASGFGDSLDQVADALIRVKQNFKDIKDEAQLEQITRDSIILAETFDSDVNEVTRAGSNLIRAFGVESSHAFNLMATGAQKGLNFSNEMFDNLAEYSPLFASMGYTADEYFEILVNGSNEAVYNLDYINDVMKEFQIRVKDGSKTTDDAMSKMSKSTQTVWKEFLKGNKTVKDVSNTVLKELESMDNQVLANQIAIDLYGTKFEDLESTAVYSLRNVEGGIGDVTNAMDKMAKAQEETFSQRWQSLLRDAQKELEPIGSTILDIAEEWLPRLSNGLERAVTWFDELGEEGQGFILTLAGIAAAAGPVIGAGGMIASGAGSVMKLGSSLMDAASKGGALGAVMSTISGPAGWAILGAAAITGLGVAIYNMNKEIEISTEELIKLQEENFKNATSTYENAKATNELALEYEGLREKSKLSTDQMLEFKDLQNEISSTTSDEKLAQLKARQDELYGSSGLTNEELDRMIKLDGDLQANAPGVKLAFDSKGNAVIGYKNAIVEATQAQLELAKANLESEMIDNLFAMEESYEKIAEAQRKQKEAYEESLRYQDEYNVALVEQQKFEEEYYALLGQINKMKADTNKYSSEEIRLLEDQLAEMMGQGTQLRENADWLKEQQETHYGIYEEQTKELVNLNKQIKLTETQYNQYMDILAAEVDIVGEQGKQLKQMKDKYNENAKVISQLETKLQTEGKISDKEQEQLNKLKEQQKQLQNNISEAEEMHTILGKDITKKITFDDGGYVSWLNSELGKTVTKKVVTKVEDAWNNLKKYEKGTNYHPGGVALVGEKGAELGVLPTGQEVLLGVDGQGLYDLPIGTKVYDHLKTQRLLDLDLQAFSINTEQPTIFGQLGSSILSRGSSESTLVNRVSRVTSTTTKGISGINQSITIISPTPTSPSENARLMKQAARQQAMEWGVV